MPSQSGFAAQTPGLIEKDHERADAALLSVGKVSQALRIRPRLAGGCFTSGHFLGGFRPDFVKLQQNTVPGKRVSRVGEYPHEGKNILHVSRFGKFQTAPLLIVESMGAEFDFQLVGVKPGAEQNGDVRKLSRIESSR